MRHYDGTEIMMMSQRNIEGSLQDSEYKDQVEVMRSVKNKIKYTERERERYLGDGDTQRTVSMI